MMFFSMALQGRGTRGYGHLLSPQDSATCKAAGLAREQQFCSPNTSKMLKFHLHITGAGAGELFCRRLRERQGWLQWLRIETSVCLNQTRNCLLPIFPSQQLPQSCPKPEEAPSGEDFRKTYSSNWLNAFQTQELSNIKWCFN